MLKLFRIAFAVLLAVAAVATPALAQEVYRIGMSAAITGRAAAGYAPTYEAYRAYFKRVNDAGGINGRKVEIEYEDDRGEAQRAAAAGKKLGENSILIVNASISATYKPLMTEAETSKVPLLFGGGVCPREAFPPASPLIFCSTSFGSKWDSRFVLGFIKERAARARRIEAGLLQSYARLLKSRGGLAVVPVKDSNCGGCFVAITPQAHTEVRKGEALLTCANCQRILYWKG